MSYIIYYLSVAILCTSLFPIFNAQAQVQEQKTFTTPKLLTQAAIESDDDVLKLLKEDKFHQELAEIAKQLDVEVIDQQPMFNKVALLSILEKHKVLLDTVAQERDAMTYSFYTLHSQTQLQLNQSEQRLFTKKLTDTFGRKAASMSDEALFQINSALGWSVTRAQDYVHNVFKRYKDLPMLNREQVIDLIVNTHIYRVLSKVIPVTEKLLNAENSKRYVIVPDTLITTPDGIELSATIVKKRNFAAKLPAALQFTIYANESVHIKTAIHAAVHGYVGVVANSRGKRSSLNDIVPWEHEGEDASKVIDWITHQPWNNGDVVMYGGSYNGFTQWAAAKHMHPALKAMAPYSAASLITGLPYENNIMITGNYEWAFHVTNNKTMDNSVYADWQKSNQLLTTLFESGRATKDIDKIDGKPNPWFQKWLSHPSFDSYYQKMVPYKHEYADINIPVLSITGYFDGGQISAVDYLKRHYKYNQNAKHWLLIGPYNHGTAQGQPNSYHSNYKLDDVALEKDTEEVVFDWFDFVLYGGEKPKLIQDKVNYQLMGSNQWRHSGSLDGLNKQSKTFYLSTSANIDERYSLLLRPEKEIAYVSQTVDMADRTTQHNSAPWPVISSQLNEPNGLVYVTQVFDKPQELAGSITGHFSISVNKKDVDIGYNFYEIDEQGNTFHLNNYRSRASYASDMSKRQLLTPNKKTNIAIVNARMTAKLIKKGSRLAIVLNVNKNRDAQVNMGSGKNVSEESKQDAGEPLNLKWFNDSQINIPLKPWKNQS
ncbi:MAG: putative CocE/NonD family hydrolase [Paraglaciecola sp.]|jgi:putative CocE/NonD family hydrolase